MRFCSLFKIFKKKRNKKEIRIKGENARTLRMSVKP